MSSNKRYFYNLDGLRFIAAITVAFSHLETVKSYLPLSYLKNRFIENSAQLSVTFFFVLSGFLIMWWLLEETNGDIQQINIKRFYVNRISRTWPLYFFIVLFSFLISIVDGSFFGDPFALKRYIYYVFWMPNLADLWYKPNIYLGQTWSLAVEEFFYLFFPLFLVKVRTKSLINLILSVLVFFLILGTFLNAIFIKTFYPNLNVSSFGQYLITFFERYRIYSFLSGALAAIVLYYGAINKLNLSLNRLKVILIFTSSLVAIMFLFGLTFSFLTHQIYSILFSIILLLFSYTGNYSRLLNCKLFMLGGKFSYGIYMLHMFVVMRLVNQGSFLLKYDNVLMSIITSWLLLFAFIFIISYISFRFFENPVRIWARNYYLKNGVK